MLIPTKNHNFLNYLIERILEIIDEKNQVVRHYITNEEAAKSEIEEHFENVIGDIASLFYSPQELSGENKKKIIKVIMSSNQLKKDEPLLENAFIKINPGKQYLSEHSLSILWNRVGEEKSDIFNLFPNETNKNNMIIFYFLPVQKDSFNIYLFQL